MLNKINKIKICFVSIFAYPLFNKKSSVKFGGSEVQMYLIAKELAKDSTFNVDFVVGDFGQKAVEYYNYVNIFKACKRGRDVLNLIKAPIKLYCVLKKVNPDIILCRAPGVETGISAFYAKINNKKFIYSIASDIDVKNTKKQNLRRKIFQYGLRNADIVIAQTNNQIKSLKEKYGSNFSKISLIRHSFPLKENKKQKKDIILWVGRSVKLKNPQVFLELAKFYPKEKFVMIMPKNDVNLWDKITTQAKQIKNLKSIEQVPFSEINKYFNKAKIFINTSDFEGFPNTFVQAMHTKTPILSLKVNPDNFLYIYKCGMSCNNDFNYLRDNLYKILTNKNYYNTLAKNCLIYTNKNHNIKQNIKKWKNTFKSL